MNNGDSNSEEKTERKFALEKTYVAFFESGKRIERSLAACFTVLFFCILISFFSDPLASKIRVPVVNAELSYQNSCLVLIGLGALLTLRHLLLFLYNRILYFRLWSLLYKTNGENVWPLQYPSSAGFIALSPAIPGIYRNIAVSFGVVFGIGMHFIPLTMLLVVGYRSEFTLAIALVGIFVVAATAVSFFLLLRSRSVDEPKRLSRAFDRFDQGYPADMESE